MHSTSVLTNANTILLFCLQNTTRYDNANSLAVSMAPSGNSSVYFNVLVNISAVGLRSKAMASSGTSSSIRTASPSAPPSPSSQSPSPAPSSVSSCDWRWENNVVVSAGVGFETQYMAGVQPPPVHGDCVINNIFACDPAATSTLSPSSKALGAVAAPSVASSAAAGCKTNYRHHVGWIPNWSSADVYNNNLYWPKGALFCSRSSYTNNSTGCVDLAGWAALSHGAVGNGSAVADPLFADTRAAARPDGLKPAVASAAFKSGDGAVFARWGLPAVDFSGTIIPEKRRPDIGAFVIA